MFKRFAIFYSFLTAIWHPEVSARYYDIYRADYVKGAFCAVIGGACAADVDFDSSFFQNPASLTAGGGDWDYDYDMIQGKNLEPGMKGANNVKNSVFMAAAAESGPHFGMGVSFLMNTTQVSALGTFSDDAAGGTDQFQTYTKNVIYQFNIPLSWKINSDYDVGVTLTALWQTTSMNVSGVGGTASVSADQTLPSLGLSVGGIYKIANHFISGGWLHSPMTYYMTQKISTQSNFTKFSFSEDMALHYPWLWAVGVGWTPWDDKNGIYFDLNYVGSTSNGFLLTDDNFASVEADNRLIHKGTRPVVDPRLGVRLPLGKGANQTISLGTYYENSRWDGYPGLTHFTGGFAWKFPKFKFLMFDGIEFMVGTDVAKDYQTVFFTYR